MPDINPVSIPNFDVVPHGAPTGQVDTSMYNRLSAALPPMLGAKDFSEMRQQAASTQNMMNQNKIFQMEVVGKQALAEHAKNALDPKTGELDVSKFVLSTSQDPRTAYIAPGIATQYMQQGMLKKQIYLQDMNNHIAETNAALELVAPLAGLGTQATPDDVNRAVDQGYATGIIKDPHIAIAIKTRAYALKGGQPLANYIKQVQLQLMGSAEAGKLTMGQITLQDQGGVTGAYVAAPGLPEGQQIRRIGTLDKGPTSAEQSALVQHPASAEEAQRYGVPENTPIASPRIAVAPMATGEGRLVGGPQHLGGFGGPEQTAQPAVQPTVQAPGQAPALAPGVNRAAKQPLGVFPGGSDRGQVAPTGVPGPQGFVAGLSPGEEEYQKGMGTAQKDFEEDLNQGADAAGKLQTEMEWMRNVLKATNLKTGGGAGLYRTFGDMLDAVGAPKNVVDTASLGSRAGTFEFEKSGNRMILDQLRLQFQGLGRVLQSEFSTIAKTFPTEDMPREAIENILKFLDYQSNLVQVQQQMYGKYIHDHARLPDGRTLSKAQWPAYWNRFLADNGFRSPPVPHELEAKPGEK